MVLKAAAVSLALLAVAQYEEVPAEWWAATPARAVSGEASYYAPGLMAAVARYRGLSLVGYAGGVAMMRQGDIGREVWALLDGAWRGPFRVVDCAQREHYPGLVARERVIELDWSTWQSLGLPNAPVPVVVSFDDPWPGPAMQWQ